MREGPPEVEGGYLGVGSVRGGDVDDDDRVGGMGGGCTRAEQGDCEGE